VVLSDAVPALRPHHSDHAHHVQVRSFLGKCDALEGEEAMCTICQMDYEEGNQLAIMPACAHAFHEECISTWLKDKATCPVCMRDVKQDLRAAWPS